MSDCYQNYLSELETVYPTKIIQYIPSILMLCPQRTPSTLRQRLTLMLSHTSIPHVRLACERAGSLADPASLPSQATASNRERRCRKSRIFTICIGHSLCFCYLRLKNARLQHRIVDHAHRLEHSPALLAPDVAVHRSIRCLIVTVDTAAVVTVSFSAIFRGKISSYILSLYMP